MKKDSGKNDLRRIAVHRVHTQQEQMAGRRAERRTKRAAGAGSGMKPKPNPKRKLLIAGGALLLLVILSVSLFFPLRAAGVFLRAKTVASTEHYKVNGAMYSYYFYSSFYEQLAGSAAQVYKNNGIEENSDLKSLTYGELPTGEKESWFDFFEGEASLRLVTILQYAEAAADANVTLSAGGEATLEGKIADLRSKAAGRGLSFSRYLAQRFGRGVKEKDIREFLEIYLLAGEMADRLKKDLPVSEEELEGLRADPAYQKASLFYYVCKADISASMSEGQKEERKTEARENAHRLAGISDPQLFINEVRRQEEHLAEHSGEELTDELFEEIMADFIYYDISCSMASAIDEKIASRKKGETLLISSEETGSYGVVLVVEPLHLDERTTHNYRTVTFSDAAAAASVMASLTGGDGAQAAASLGHTTLTEEKFRAEALAKGGKDSGRTEDCLPGSMAGSQENEMLAAWLQNEGVITDMESASQAAGDRRVGDMLLLIDGESDSGGEFLPSGRATLYYYCGEGRTPFEKAATNRILSEKYVAIDVEIAEKYASVTVKENSGAAVADRR